MTKQITLQDNSKVSSNEFTFDQLAHLFRFITQIIDNKIANLRNSKNSNKSENINNNLVSNVIEFNQSYRE